MSVKLNILWVRLRPYLNFATLVYALFSAAFGSIPLLSLLQKLLRAWNWKIEFVGIPKLLLAEYLRIRVATFGKIIELLHQLSIPIPQWLADFFTTWVADFLVIYVLITISVVRGSLLNRRLDRIKFHADPKEFRGQLRSAALLHDRDPQKFIVEVEGGLEPGFIGWLKFQKRVWIGAIRWPFVIKRNFVQLHRGVATDFAISLMVNWATMLMCAFLGVAVYLLGSVISS